jgi:glycosyltransferase involved in cell wall biosynthesis
MSLVKLNGTTVILLATGLGVGGAERVVIELASSLSEQGTDVLVVSMTDDLSILNQYDNRPSKIISLSIRRSSFLSFLKGLLMLRHLVVKYDVKLIHAHMFHALFISFLCKISRRKPLSIVFTSHSFSGFKGLRKLILFALRPFRAADVIFSSRQHPELNCKTVRTIANGVSSTKTSTTTRSFAGTFVFLALGRLEEPKSPVELIRQFSMMDNESSELWFVGDGYLRDEMQWVIEEYGLEHKIKLLGIRQDVPEILASVHCLVMPSLWEGLPMALLEAGAAALPVIATPVGAIPDLIDGHCGYLVEISEFHFAMDIIVADYPAAVLRGQNLARKIFSDYSLESMVRKHSDLYLKILSDI